MRVRVKVCGMTDEAAVRAAASAGADAVGFVFAESPRRVTPERAAALARGLPRGIARVAVFRHPSFEEVQRVLRVLSPDWIQTDAADLGALGAPGAPRMLPVFRDGPDVIGAVERHAATCRARRPRVLFESQNSGSGTAPDWERAAALATRVRLVLAGGLDADSVALAIRRVGPYAVDVSSGVESSRGVKDPERIHAFVRAARGGKR